jgi:hypothetical protein
MGDGLQTSQRARHRFDDVPRGWKASASLGEDDLAVDLHLEAAGMAPDENRFYAERLTQGLERGVGLGQVVASDAIKNSNHRSGGCCSARGCAAH